MTHDELVTRACNWLRGYGCQYTLAGPNRWSVPETPDAIGWHNGLGILVECKTSFADFRADAQKTWRKGHQSALGSVRYYMVPKALAAEIKDKLPAKWGLLAVYPKIVRVVVRPELWPDEAVYHSGEKHILAGAIGWENGRTGVSDGKEGE